MVQLIPSVGFWSQLFFFLLISFLSNVFLYIGFLVNKDSNGKGFQKSGVVASLIIGLFLCGYMQGIQSRAFDHVKFNCINMGYSRNICSDLIKKGP